MASLGVAVVIPNFNYGNYLERAIRSVLHQTHPPDELVVVDDGSTDDSLEVAASFGPPVRLLQQRNRGVAAARNAGVAASSAPLVAFLDADDEWYPGKLEHQVAELRTHPGLGLVHCGMDVVAPEGHVLARHTDGLQGFVARDLLLLKEPGIVAGGSSALVPRTVWSSVGGFDERLSTSADWEFFLRIALRFPVGFVPLPLVRYTFHHRSMRSNLVALEHDILLGLEKFFEAQPEQSTRLRPQALAQLYLVLSGSHLANREPWSAARCLARSVQHRPANLAAVAQLALRRLKRRVGGGTERSGSVEEATTRST